MQPLDFLPYLASIAPVIGWIFTAGQLSGKVIAKLTVIEEEIKAIKAHVGL